MVGKSMKAAGGKSHLDKRMKERLSAKHAPKKLVSGKKSLEKPVKKVASGKSNRPGSIPMGPDTPVALPPRRKRRGLQALKRCIQMQQSTDSMVREAPFRRSLNQRVLTLERKVLNDTPYLHLGDAKGPAPKQPVGFNKSVGAVAGLMTVLGKKATDLLRCAASYAAAAGRHAVNDTDVLRAAMQDEDLATYIDENEVLRGVLDQRDVDGERTRRLQREQPFVGVKAHIYHTLKGNGSSDEEGDGESEQSDSEQEE